MDGDPKQKENSDPESYSERPMSFIGYLLQSTGIRCSICTSDEVDGIFSRNRYYFLLHFNFFFLMCIFFIKKRYF